MQHHPILKYNFFVFVKFSVGARYPGLFVYLQAYRLGNRNLLT